MTGRVRVSSYAVSIDGFAAGPEQSLQNPLGESATHRLISRKATV